MKPTQELIMLRPLAPEESQKEAVYCIECDILKQDQIGSKCGTCEGHQVFNSLTPMKCHYYKNAHSIISILVFLKGSGLPIYNKAIVKDLTKEIDPGLLSSYLEALSAFGMELTNESVSQIQFQKMKIIFSRGENINGALILKGESNEEIKNIFSHFIQKIEESFPNYISGNSVGMVLPERQVDKLGYKSLQKYVKKRFYPVSNGFVGNLVTQV
jgi:hypothetical protein